MTKRLKIVLIVGLALLVGVTVAGIGVSAYTGDRQAHDTNAQHINKETDGSLNKNGQHNNGSEDNQADRKTHNQSHDNNDSHKGNKDENCNTKDHPHRLP